MTDLALSNSLTDLAAKVKAEHKAVTAALSKAVEHALNAGAYLAEAKETLKHGQWLPWLERCQISRRTAQLYMQLHRRRKTIEKELRNSQSGPDLTLNEAAAMCVLAGRIDRLMDFARKAPDLQGDALVDLCVKEGFGVIVDEDYELFLGRSDEEKRDWLLFGLWIGGGTASAFDHVEWIMQRPFHSIDEWMGSEGDKYRGATAELNGKRVHRMSPVSEKVKEEWRRYRDKMVKGGIKTAADADTEIKRIRATPGFLKWAAEHPGM
jgi:hypothetical protein